MVLHDYRYYLDNLKSKDIFLRLILSYQMCLPGKLIIMQCEDLAKPLLYHDPFSGENFPL